MTPSTGSGAAPTADAAAGAAAPAVIEATALTKVYPGDVTALGGLTVNFAPGVTGLIGANGAGKIDAHQDPPRAGGADQRHRHGARP